MEEIKGFYWRSGVSWFWNSIMTSLNCSSSHWCHLGNRLLSFRITELMTSLQLLVPLRKDSDTHPVYLGWQATIAQMKSQTTQRILEYPALSKPEDFQLCSLAACLARHATNPESTTSLLINKVVCHYHRGTCCFSHNWLLKMQHPGKSVTGQGRSVNWLRTREKNVDQVLLSTE